MKLSLNFLALGLGFISVMSVAQAQERISVGTIERPPFMMQTDTEALTGFSIDLMDAIADRLGISVDYHEFTVFSEMVSATEIGEMDMSIANISVTAGREKTMDYSQPIYDAGLQVMVPSNAKKMPLWKTIWESGIFYFLGFAVLVLLVIAHLLWWLERGRAGQRHNYFRDDYLGGVWDAFWWAFIVMTMGGFENEVPHSVRSRALAILWIVVSLFFISTLTAKITTSLTVAELQSDINSYRDLYGKKVGITASPTARSFLEKEGLVANEYDSLETLLEDLNNGGLDAVVQDAPILSYYANHEGQGKVRLVGEIFKPEKYAILFGDESLYREQFDQVLAEFKEDGSYQKLKRRYFGNQ